MEGRGSGAILIFLWVQGEPRELDPQAAGDQIDALFRAACAMCGDRQLAEELVQETYVRVLSRPRLIRREDDLGYLVKALRNTWYDHLRSERTRRAATADTPEGAAELPGRGGDPQQAVETGAVLSALSELPDPYREAVAAVDLAGLSYAEAAKALGVREGTVMSRLYRGRERVAQALEA